MMIEDHQHCFEMSSEQFSEEFHLVEILSIVNLKFKSDATERVSGAMLSLERPVESRTDLVDPESRLASAPFHRNHRQSDRSRCLPLRTIRDLTGSFRDRPSIFGSNDPKSTSIRIRYLSFHRRKALLA